MDDDDRVSPLDAHAALVREGVLEPLSTGEAETRLWMSCELASLVENRFFEPFDPLTATPDLRAHWEPRAGSDEPLTSPHGEEWYRLPYWIRAGGERAGTVALHTAYVGIGLVTVSSLYVLPAHRRRGVAAHTLGRLQAAVLAHGGRGLRVPTRWTWQPAVRLYLGLGMWLANWKDSLVFAWHGHLPDHRIEVGEHEARFAVDLGGRVEPLLAARREGERLGWTESPQFTAVRREVPELYHLAPATFALALAVHGYPLIRSAEAWEQRHTWRDAGEPEGLAYKIELFEAWDRKQGYRIRTPRLPGLGYREWEDIDDRPASFHP
ncbi:MAG: GNAT family N-acetyltransferase [Minicystis sp.]